MSPNKISNSFLGLKYFRKFIAVLALLLIGVNVWGQTSTQDFGSGTSSNTTATGSTVTIPNPSVGTTYARAGATAPNAPVSILNSSNPLGTSGSYLRARSSTSASVTKATPILSYTNGLEFYTSFKVLFGDASATNTATSGVWTFYQGLQGTNYNDNTDVSNANTFTGLRFTFGASGALTLNYNNAGTYNSTSLTTSAFNQATVYTIEIVGNNKSNGTISYTYNGVSQTVAVQKFDLYINGTLVGNDLNKGNATANTNINSMTFTGVNSALNVANIFVDDVIVYNSVPSVIGTTPSSVTFDANGGSGTMTNQSASTATALTSNTFTRTGYTFAGWSTSAGGSIDYVDGASYPFASSTTLYAQWTANNNTLTFDGNGSTSGSTAAQTIASNASATLTTNGFSKTGYTFAGWSTTAGGSVAYADGASYTMGTGNATVYAVWTANNNTLTFDGNGSTSGSTASQTIASNASATLTSNGFVYTGYNFSGWSTTSGGSVIYPNEGSYTMGTSNATLYAVWTLATAPTISYSGSLTSVNTTYGTASSSPTSLTVSGSNLTNDISISAPSGYEIAVGSGTYASSQTLTQTSGAVANTTINVRLAATTAAGTYSGNIALTSAGATSLNVATVSSTVSQKALTISGLTGTNKEYDGSTAATFSGTASYDGFENGEVFSISGTPSATFNSASVGTNKPITIVGYTEPSANYSLTQPLLSADITAKALTVSGASATDKAYDGTTTATISGGTLVGVISPDVVTLTQAGNFVSADVGTAISVTGNFSIGGASSSNYSISQPSGLSANITQALQTITFNALSNKALGAVDYNPGATASSGLTITYASSNTSVATIVNGFIHLVGEGTTNITASQAGNGNYAAASDVSQNLTVQQLIAAWDFYGSTAQNTVAATNYNANLVSSGINITRGSGAAASTGGNSFRTQGFQNNGISTSNTDYFQITFTASPCYNLSLTSIDAKFIGTNTFYATPGVTSQFAYSLDGTNFTLIGSPVTSTSLNMALVDLSSSTALQNISAGTTVTIRYYASGQTTTGGWGFSSSSVGDYGLSIGGILSSVPTSAPTAADQSFCSSSSPTVSNLTATGSSIQWYAASSGGSALATNTALANSTAYFASQTVGGCESVTRASSTITLSSNNTASAASSSPSLCINTPLTNITHTTTGATGIGTATGLPAGVTAAWASNTITISGTPSASGTFSYSIPLSGGCGSVNATGTITVTPANTVGTASSSPTLCINSALTNITHTTTGASGIGTATGLPAGVTASWASNTITISGTPSASGTFSYSIPLSGGCGSVNATGTIIVNALPTVTATASQSICPGSSVTLSGGGASTYAWDNGITNGVVFTPSTTTTYTVTGTDGNGCANTANSTVSIYALPNWGNLQWPPSGTICAGGTYDIYGQVYENGVTNASYTAPGAGIVAQFGYSSSNSNPNTWTTWANATYNTGVGNNDEFKGSLSGLSAGTYYYAFRYALNNGTCYVYGAYSGSGGGFWDGSNNVSGVLTVTSPTANAGADITGASTCGKNTITVNATALNNNETGAWSVVTQGAGATLPGLFSAFTTPTDDFTGSYGGTYTLAWTVTNTTTNCTNTDNMVVTFNQPITSSLGSSIGDADFLWNGLTSVDWSTGGNWFRNVSGVYQLQTGTIEPTSTNQVFSLTAAQGGVCIGSNMPTIGNGDNALDVFVGSGITLNLASGSLNLSGNLVNNGTINAAQGTVNFIGSTNATVSGSGATTLNNVTINKSSGATLTLSTNVAVNGILNMTQGNVFTATSPNGLLTLGSSSAVPGTLSWTSGNIVGPFRRFFTTAATQGNEGLFPVGTATYQRYAKVNFTASPGTNQSLTAWYKAGAPMSAGAALYNGLPLTTQDGQLIQNYSADGYWQIDPTDNNYNATINSANYSIELYANNLTGMQDPTICRIIKAAGSNTSSSNHVQWQGCGTHTTIPTGTSASAFAINSTSVVGFSWFGVGTSNNQALPVALTSFSGNCADGKVVLEWSTATEHNSAYFQVEYSRDGEIWQNIGVVAAAGNSVQNINYTLTHQEVANGNNYYRLRQVDIDGVEQLYDVIAVNCATGSDQYIMTYPNPSEQNFQVALLDENLIGTATLSMVDARGMLIHSELLEVKAGTNLFLFNNTGLAPGIYYVKISKGAYSSEVVKQVVR